MTPQTKKPTIAFRSARAKDQEIYDKISLAVVEFDTELNILYANLAVQNLLGLKQSDIDAGLDVADIVAPELVDLVNEAFTSGSRILLLHKILSHQEQVVTRSP